MSSASAETTSQKSMPQKTLTSSGSMQWSMALQLFISHCIAAVAAFGTYAALSNMGMRQSTVMWLCVLLGGVLGLLLTANMQYGLYLLHLALSRFAQGETVEQLNTTRRWPFAALFSTLNDVSRQIHSYAQQAHLTNEYREQLLHQASEAAALEERNRIARELHDSIKQQIFSISMSAAAAKAHSGSNSDEDVKEAVEDIQRSAKEAQVEMQALLQQLHAEPLENTNLADALQTQAQALGYRTGAQMIVEIGELPPPDRLLPTAQHMIFRMAQEAFANIARHARANTVWLTLEQRENALHVEIRDDGQGFDETHIRKGMGLNNLNERAAALGGSVTIQSAIGKGTSIHAVLPLVEPLSVKQERKQSERALKRLIEQATWGFQLGENIAPVAMLLIFAALIFSRTFTIPFFAIAICTLIGLYGYLQGEFFTARTALILGNEQLETLLLRRRAQSVRAWLLRLLILGLWYMLIINNLQRYPFFWEVAFGLTIFFFALSFIARQFQQRTTNRYYALLSKEELSAEVTQRHRAIVVRLRLLALGIAATVFNFISSFTFPPTTVGNWANYIATIAVSAWGILAFIDYLQIRGWVQKIERKQSNEQ